MQTKVNLLIILKSRYARGTLLAPIQFPIMPQVAYDMPQGTIHKVIATLLVMTWAASWCTPNVAAITVKIS